MEVVSADDVVVVLGTIVIIVLTVRLVFSVGLFVRSLEIDLFDMWSGH
jgi:hypothetical protein